ncbi:MAG: hypothetical protein AB3X44_08245 [Leptothrix sp. (in: b-proteobacteria)]
MVHSKQVAIWAVLAGAGFFAGAAFAGHPLQTEDTGTQGVGKVELENGLSWSNTAGTQLFAFEPQVAYGLTPTVDLIVQPSWLRSRDESGLTVRGWGDTIVDGKWRFVDDEALSFAVRAGVSLATSQNGLGIEHGKVSTHAVLVATYEAAPFTVHGNLGLTQNPGGTEERTLIGRVSGALTWAANDALTLAVDAGAESNPDPTRRVWISSLLAGAIYTLRPELDVDVGYQSSLNAPINTHVWLVGLTYRFAL